MGGDVAQEHGAMSTEVGAPASTAVGVAGLIGGALVEIDAIAFIADR
jgi:enamine deaminase RidA (YjgF/YER057c/UK114 family)